MRKASLHTRLLLELEDNKIDYGWATEDVLRLCKLNPEITPFLTKAPAHTQHFVVLCLLGFMQQHDSRTTLRELSKRIATEERRALLSEAWNKDFGSTRILHKLCAGVFPKAYYPLLMACLAEPARRAMFLDVGVVYHLVVERVARATPEHLQRYRPIGICNFGGVTLDFLHKGLCQLRPDLTPDDILMRMNALKSASGMSRLMEALTKQLPVPMPVWPGTDTIIPLQRAHDFKATGLLMRNCLNNIEMWIEGLQQERVFYFCDGEEPAIAAMKRHRLFDQWFLHEVSGRENKRLSAPRKAEIVEAFEKAGFLYPDVLALNGLRIPGF
jgi:hypothetical protein